MIHVFLISTTKKDTLFSICGSGNSFYFDRQKNPEHIYFALYWYSWCISAVALASLMIHYFGGCNICECSLCHVVNFKDIPPNHSTHSRHLGSWSFISNTVSLSLEVCARPVSSNLLQVCAACEGFSVSCRRDLWHPALVPKVFARVGFISRAGNWDDEWAGLALRHTDSQSCGR